MKKIEQSTSPFRLLFEIEEGEAGRGQGIPFAGCDAAGALAVLEVPSGVSYLTTSERSVPELSSNAGPVLLEILSSEDRPLLLLLRTDAEPRVTVNGMAAPRVVCLGVGDELSVDGGPALFVTRYATGPQPTEEDAGTCPVCRSGIDRGQRVHACPCGTRLHAESAETVDEPLECAWSVAGKCPDCRRSLQLEPGYEYLPPGLRPAPDLDDPWPGT